jgi:hypothetical protein
VNVTRVNSLEPIECIGSLRHVPTLELDSSLLPEYNTIVTFRESSGFFSKENMGCVHSAQEVSQDSIAPQGRGGRCTER